MYYLISLSDSGWRPIHDDAIIDLVRRDDRNRVTFVGRHFHTLGLRQSPYIGLTSILDTIGERACVHVCAREKTDIARTRRK